MSETQEFWLSQPRYLQQAGEHEPQYVPASPSNPVRVVLPATITRGGDEIDQPEDAHLHRVRQAEPKKLRSVLPKGPKKNVAKKLPVPGEEPGDEAGEAASQ